MAAGGTHKVAGFFLGLILLVGEMLMGGLTPGGNIAWVQGASVQITGGRAWAQSAPEFPKLTGRVVDQANMLSPQAEARLTQMLAAHEQATTEQLVVVTLPSLNGNEIADYGYRLGRHWGIGQKGKDNGALLIVAQAERKLRIEVGYGLEERLTDAASSFVISRVITPEFQAGRFEQGILAGVESMLKILGGEAIPAQAVRERESEEGPNLPLPFLLFMMFFIITGALRGGSRRSRRYRRGIFYGGMAGGGFGGLGGGGFGGGGFGGGGGGFGGGGASGGW